VSAAGPPRSRLARWVPQILSQPFERRYGRHRDKGGEISKKHGNTLISTLRERYGESFAKGEPGTAKLG
jgi:hypothetical protein